MKQSKEKCFTSPITGMTYRIDPELSNRKKQPMFPEKIARITEIIRKSDMSILEKRNEQK